MELSTEEKELANKMARVLEFPFPTELPKKKSATQRVENEFEKDTRRPKRAEKKGPANRTNHHPEKHWH